MSAPFVCPPIEKGPPRPAPTQAYNFREYNPNATVLYIRNHEHANRVLAKLSRQTVFGFDLEWKPTFQRAAKENPVALVQLANDDTIILFQITAMRKFPSKLVEVLENPHIIKAGVAIQSDAKKLFNDYRVPIRNCVDLALMARTVDNARWQGRYHSAIGLAHLIESYEYRLLPKGKTTRSNWEAALDANQREYASNDAHAGYTLYKRLETMITLMPTPPEATWYSFSNIAGFSCNDDGLPWIPINPNYDPGPLPPPKPPTEARLDRGKQKQEDSLVEQASPPASQLEAGAPQDIQLQLQPGPSRFQAVSSRQLPIHFSGDGQPSSMRALPGYQERRFHQTAMHQNSWRDGHHRAPSHINTLSGSPSLPPRAVFPFQHQTIGNNNNNNNDFSRGNGRGRGRGLDERRSSGQPNPEHRNGRHPYRPRGPPVSSTSTTMTTHPNPSTPTHSASSNGLHPNAGGS